MIRPRAATTLVTPATEGQPARRPQAVAEPRLPHLAAALAGGARAADHRVEGIRRLRDGAS